LRDAYSGAHIEILGYAHIAALAERRFYADAVRSIEYGALSRFFARGAELPDDLVDYFAGFDLIVSYLFDPDLIFQTNLERAGVSEIITGPGKLTEGLHAARQLAQPMIADLELELETTSATIFPTDEDRAFAAEFLRDLPHPIIALHPGSGSERKNWPLPKWLKLGNRLLASPEMAGSLLLVSGEADAAQASNLRSTWPASRIREARGLRLTQLAAILERSAHFVGHDSGISHLAGAVGAHCILLFGPTDPAVWAPSNPNVRVLRAPGGNLGTLSVESVLSALLTAANI
jgi:heptosyltransferase-2